MLGRDTGTYEQPARPPAGVEREPDRSGRHAARRLATRTILVADADAQHREAVAFWLRHAGFQVVEVGRSTDLFARAADRPDVVLLAGELPDRGGFEIANRLKNDATTMAIPVIHVTSGYTTGEWRAQGLDAGADAFLTHPVEPSELIATVRALLRVRAAEEEVRAAAAEWQATFDAITDAVCLINHEGDLQRCNDAADVLLGRLNEGHGSRTFQEIFPPPGGVGQNVGASVIESGQQIRYQSHVKDRWFAVTLDPMPAGRDVPASVVAVVSDVTQRMLAEEERARLLEHAERARREAEISRLEAEAARREAEKANRAKSEFLAVMSHELRTPLNAIDGYAELLELEVRGPITPAQRDDIRRIRRSQKLLLSLINDVLNFVRLDAGTVRYEIRDFSLQEAIRSVEDVTAPQLRARRLRFVKRGCEAAARVRADREKVEQILVNLMTNAIKFTEPDGTITLECEVGDRRVAIRVRDTGRGIPADKLSEIFEPFVQVARSAGAPSEGVGLGLAISRDLSRAMGGDLVAESTMGEGSVFTLTLPGV